MFGGVFSSSGSSNYNPASVAITGGTITGTNVPYVLAQSAVAVSGAADTNENILATITIPAGAMGPNGTLCVSMSGTMTNNANTKTYRARLGGIAGAIVASNATSSVVSSSMQISIQNRNNQSSQVTSQPATSFQAATANYTVALTTAAIDTSVVQTFVITGQKATGSDTLTLERYFVELAYGA